MGRRILVIKLGALGDFIYALGPMAAIRRHHKDDRITLLTTAPFEKMARDTGYFDDIILDKKPRWHDPCGWLALAKTLNEAGFSRVYDLQNNDRTGLYFRLFSPRPEWVGVAKGASHRNTSPDRISGHAFYGHTQTLALASIGDTRLDDLSWMAGSLDRFALKAPFALLVPGCSPQRPEKRWPPERYRAVALALLGKNIQPVLLGGPAESSLNAEIARGLEVLNLTGQTSLYEIAALARKAAGAIGNDTGPSHMIAVSGCPIVMLFCTRSSTVKKHGPIGPAVKTLESVSLEEIEPAAVLEAFSEVVRP